MSAHAADSPAVTGPPEPAAATATRPRRRRRGALRRRARRTVVVGHRWIAIALGVALLVMSTSGSVLLYQTQLDRLLHPGLYATTHGRAIPVTRALAIARHDRSHLTPTSAALRDGAWIVSGTIRGSGRPRELHIDAASGRVHGLGAIEGGVLGWLANLHECGLGCSGFAGYTPLLAKPAALPGDPDLTVGGLLIGIVGLTLGWLLLSGLWLWWPRIRRVARGFVVRRGRGTYALHYDLHKVVGIAALPFLAMWALTGTGFQFNQVQDVWYALLPGTKPPAYVAPTASVRGATIPVSAARRDALAAVPGSRFDSMTLPAAGDPTSTYTVNVSSGFDPLGHGPYAGDVTVAVDRHTGATDIAYPTAYSGHRPLAQAIWQDWQFAGHAGEPVNGWWRLAWLAFGLSPLVLAVTAIVTWTHRRRNRRRRRRRGDPSATGTSQPVAA